MAANGKALEQEENEEVLVREAREAINRYFAPGQGSQRNAEAYNETSAKYEQYMAAFDYSGNQVLAKTLEGLYPDHSQREKVRILDVAAGTGLAGLAAYQCGFRAMDAVDASQGMLNEAAKKNIYGKLYKEFVTEKELPIEQDTYDCVIMVGGMGENQMPCEAFHELIRLVKPGGYIVNVARVEHLETCTGYTGRLEPLMTSLETQGRWTQVTREPFPNILRGKEGLLMVHQIL